MITHSRITRLACAAALALAAAATPALAQQKTTFSQTYFFGDSLSDSGFYRNWLIQNFGPAAAAGGRFTNNPGLVWAEFLADYYGTTGTPAWYLGGNGPIYNWGTGTNYSAGGARNDQYPGYPPSPPTAWAPPVSVQVNAYLSRTGGIADPKALYTVWAGANDLFFTLGGAMTPVQFLGSTTTQVASIGRLYAAGARYVMVPNMPDVGKTPFGFSLGPTGSANVTGLVTNYNTKLFGEIAAAGYHVIPLNTFGLINEIVAAPSLYGFTNATSPACGAVPSLQCANAPNTYAFADGVHPTTSAHQILAQFAIATIEGPRQMAILPYSAAMVGRARSDMLGVQMALRPEGDGMRWWGDFRWDGQRFGRGAWGDGFDGGGPTLSAGVDWASGNLVYGLFGGFGQQRIDWGYRRGDFKQKDASIGGYAGWYSGPMWANAQLSYSWLGFDTRRDVILGAATRTHAGSTNGHDLSLGINGGWEFKKGALTHGPVVGANLQKIRIDGFAEDQPGLSTSLAYPSQDYTSTIGSAGWQASYAIKDTLVPYAKLTYDHEFDGAPEQVFGQVQTMPNTLPYAVPGLGMDRSYGTLTYGIRSKLWGMDMVTGSALTVGQKGGDHASFFMTVGSKF